MMTALLIYAVVMVLLFIVPLWIVFTKAGQPGWAVIIPIYNFYVMLQIAQKPTWWLILILLVPIANIIFLIMTIHGISVNFGKDTGFTVGMILLPFIFIPILGYGGAKYTPQVVPGAPVA
jgi:hypothetical protein